jgi:ABC-type Fe3+/spermidine/putrescine transport system ATPase subunit
LNPRSPSSGVRVDGVTKRFGAVVAVDDVSFDVPAGRFVVLLGPSGSGKTTILRMVAGLEVPNSGRIWLGEKDATTVPAHRRGVGYVFQRPSMFPHYTVRENIGWGLKLRRMPKAEIERRVAEMIDLVHLDGLEQRYVTQLSGGQAQRVAIARALAPDPPILLLDEPLSSLDAKLRDELKDVIAEVQQRTSKTTIMVTHDQREALSLADTVVVMDLGRIAQLGSPTEVYRRPTSPFVASFVGSTNLVSGTVLSAQPNGRSRIRTLGQELDIPTTDGLSPGDVVQLSLRPDDLEVIEDGQRDQFRYGFEARVRQLVFLGDILRLEAEVDGEILRAHVSGRARFALLEHQPETVLLATDELAVLPSSAAMPGSDQP